MKNIFVVRANYGEYAEHFLKGHYVAIGWLYNINLSQIESREELYPLYKEHHPEDTSNLVIGQQVGQVARFLLEIKPGDYVITPSKDTDFVYYGEIEENPYFYGGTEDGCPYPHRKKVKWAKAPIQRSAFSVPFQNTIRSSLTVFTVSHKKTFSKPLAGKILYLQRKGRSNSIITKLYSIGYWNWMLRSLRSSSSTF